MSIFQLLSLLFGLSMLYLVRMQSHKQILSSLETGIWYAIWLTFCLLALKPSLLDGVVNLFHFTRVFDLLTVIAFMVVITLITINYLGIKALNQKLEEVVRRMAIDPPPKSHRNGSKIR